jgi:hypothetical protein
MCCLRGRQRVGTTERLGDCRHRFTVTPGSRREKQRKTEKVEKDKPKAQSPNNDTLVLRLQMRAMGEGGVCDLRLQQGLGLHGRSTARNILLDCY